MNDNTDMKKTVLNLIKDPYTYGNELSIEKLAKVVEYANDKYHNSPFLFESWAFSKTNYILFGVGLALIIIGYIIMGNVDVNSFQS